MTIVRKVFGTVFTGINSYILVWEFFWFESNIDKLYQSPYSHTRQRLDDFRFQYETWNGYTIVCAYNLENFQNNKNNGKIALWRIHYYASNSSVKVYIWAKYLLRDGSIQFMIIALIQNRNNSPVQTEIPAIFFFTSLYPFVVIILSDYFRCILV